LRENVGQKRRFWKFGFGVKSKFCIARPLALIHRVRKDLQHDLTDAQNVWPDGNPYFCGNFSALFREFSVTRLNDSDHNYRGVNIMLPRYMKRGGRELAGECGWRLPCAGRSGAFGRRFVRGWLVSFSIWSLR
jgi:hypothetical protein